MQPPPQSSWGLHLASIGSVAASFELFLKSLEQTIIVATKQQEGYFVERYIQFLVEYEVPQEIILKLTNLNIAAMLQEAVLTMDVYKTSKKYMTAIPVKNGQALDVMIFDPVTYLDHHFTLQLEGKIPNYSDELAGQLMRKISIANELTAFAAKQNAILFTKTTELLCNLQ